MPKFRARLVQRSKFVHCDLLYYHLTFAELHRMNTVATVFAMVFNLDPRTEFSEVCYWQGLVLVVTGPPTAGYAVLSVLINDSN